MLPNKHTNIFFLTLLTTKTSQNQADTDPMKSRVSTKASNLTEKIQITMCLGVNS